MSYELSEFGIAVVGICFGTVVAFSIFLANLAAARFGRGNALVDVFLRLGCFGLLVIGVSEVLGSLFGAQLRAHAPWFWGGFAIGFLLVPFIAMLYNRRKNG